jgi:hypothetical protein
MPAASPSGCSERHSPKASSLSGTPAACRASSSVMPTATGPMPSKRSRDEARQAAGVPLNEEAFGECRSLQPEGEAAGITLVMSGGDRINWIGVSSGPTATDRGIRLGSTKAEVLDAYQGAEVRNPDDARNWIFARSGDHAMVFVVDDGKVVEMRAGVREVMEQDEICA